MGRATSNMKCFLALVFYLLTIPIIKAQERTTPVLRILYEYRFQPIKEDTIHLVEDMVLFIGNKYSLFESYPLYRRDSLNERMFNSELVGEVMEKWKQIPHPINTTEIIKDFRTQEQFMISNLAGRKYRYKISPPVFQWKPTNTEKEIGGLKCIGATTSFAGRDYTAYYTNEITIQDGPYKFFGLPGLIVEISDSQKQFVFTLKSVKKIDYFPPINSDGKTGTEIINTTEQKYLRARKAFLDNPSAALESQGVRSLNPRETNRMIREKFERANNPIEINSESERK